MSQHIHYLGIMLALSIIQMNTYSDDTANRDGCKAIGDSCVCSNTGNRGMCFTGTLSKSGDQLYCVCQSDTFTAAEMTQGIIRKYMTPDKEKVKKYDEQLKTYPESAEILKALRYQKLLRLPKKATARERETLNKHILQNESALRMIVATGKELIVSIFFGEPHDNCRYPGQECVCSNTGAEGICSINRPGKKIIYGGAMYCHCD